ncbi:MAG: (d)CMP kinase [Syntrophales bacterium LBB04]|nr:(d)CMP kinase [Syntrophales bacterium LBB04]
MKRKLIITIDGPAGAGKSTVSKALAARLSYIYLDTGVFYRAFAFRAKQDGILPDEDAKLAKLGKDLKIQFKNDNGQSSVLIDGEEVREVNIRTEEISLLASSMSARPSVRQALLKIQREVGSEGGIVAEGRDMGTVVFPDADFKFYLDARPDERVIRRYREITSKNIVIDYEQVQIDLMRRDKLDSEREIAPLKPADDACLIDSTQMTVDDVVDKMMSLISASPA